MKIKVNKRYVRVCTYVALTCMAIYLFTVIVDSFPSILSSAGNFFDEFMDVMNPIIVALVICYLLYGPMKAIEGFFLRRKFFKNHKILCRTIGVTFAYLTIIFIFVSILFGIYYMIGGQISKGSTIVNIFDSIYEYFNSNSLSADSIQNLIESWNIPFGDFLTDKLGDIATFISKLLTGILGGVGDFVLSFGGNVFSFVISLVLSIYILGSYEYFLKLYDKVFFLIFRKSRFGKSVRHSLHIVNHIFSKYIHGQLIEAFLVFLLSTIALSIVKVDYAIVIGLICGVCNLIPYIGPFVGIVFAAIMALFSGNLFQIFGAVIALFIVQQIDSNILCPNIVGDIVGLNAAFTLIAISIGGSVAGLLGMLIAVPIAASIKTLLGDWFDRNMDDAYNEYSTKLANEVALLDEEAFNKSKKTEDIFEENRVEKKGLFYKLSHKNNESIDDSDKED